jgi:large repetitive protein
VKLLDHTSQRSSLRQPSKLVSFGLVAVMAVAIAGCGTSSDSRQRNSELTPTDIACADGGACVTGDIGPGGGIVFITPQTNGNLRPDYYLEAAPLNALAAENCSKGKNNQEIGAGKSNTEDASQSCQSNEELNAITLANDLVFNGLDDWFLPSQDELVALYANKNLFVCPANGLCSSNFTAENYWSSTFADGGQPIALNFAAANSQPVAADGASNFGVRPVRAFSTLPAAPTDVVGTPGTKSVALNWTEPAPNGSSAIISYKVLQSSNGGSTWIPGVLGADKVVTGLKDGTSYSFKVAAVNKMGAGEYSEPSKQVRTELAPCAPSSAEVGTNTVLTFSAEESCTWIVPAGVTSIDTLVVGGGAGGSNQGGNAGGGAGGSMLNGIAVEPGAKIVTTVGQGGVGATSGPDVAAGNGFDSSVLIDKNEIVGSGGKADKGGSATHGFTGGDAGKAGYSNYFSGQKIVYGAGGSVAADTTAATAAISTGNGGGAVADNTAGGAGGSGVVVIRYATDPLNAFPASFGTPFARYVAGDYQSEDGARKTWVDSSGSDRHAITVAGSPTIEVGTGNGATGNIVAVAGGTGDAVTFPDAVLPQKYTLFHVSRYAGENQGRIIVGEKGDWYSGFDDGKVGVAKHNSVMKDNGGESHSNWLLSSDQNTVYRANGVQVSTKTNGMSFSGPLTVNGSNGGPKRASDWQVAEVLVYEGELTLAQIQQLENYFARTYGLQGKNAAGTNVGILSTKSIKAKQKDEKSIDLTWTPPTDTTNLDDYVVEYSTDKKTWKLYEHTPTTSNKITVLGLDDVSEYDFRVTPSYVDVTNEQTDAGAEAVAIKTVSRAPTDVTGVPGDSKVTVSWTVPTVTGNTPIIRYEVKYSTSVDGEYVTFDDNTIAKSPAVVDGLKNGTPYFFKVAAVNTAGPGDDSAPSDAVTPRTVPGVPTNVKSTPDATGGVDVSWSAHNRLMVAL